MQHLPGRSICTSVKNALRGIFLLTDMMQI